MKAQRIGGEAPGLGAKQNVGTARDNRVAGLDDDPRPGVGECIAQ